MAEQALLGGIGKAFADRNFRIFSVGSIASWISFFVQIIAVSWFTWELTGSTSWLATMALLDIVPNVVLTPFGGVLADRYDRYRILMIAYVLALVHALVLAFLALNGDLTIWVLALMVFIHGIIISLSVPSMYGMLPRFVDKSLLSSAIAVNSSYSQFAVFAGPVLAGWIISVYGVSLAFAVNALGYVVFLGSAMLLKTPEEYVKPERSQNSVLKDIAIGADYLRQHRGIFGLLALLLVGDVLGSSFYFLNPAYAEQILGMGVEGVSLILSSLGVGATLSALWLAYQGVKAVGTNKILWSLLVYICCIAGLFLAGNVYLAVAGAVVLGITGEFHRTGTISLIQLSVAEEMRGRTMGSVFMLTELTGGIGTYLLGTFAVTRGLVTPMLIAVAVSLVLWLAFFIRRKQLIRYLDDTVRAI
ncbi:MFS transporter [Kiloniella laminariae]|uniref:MFS transporter n=1 Tax=Kiloniella laminariae TaxID=454162 RepID=A0ABT4LNY3_9PROT|nr:MFS transporter [Kiloniella laminariae]MCZ4282848.1 MFS transporter [Kiloniella laminariae]